MLFTLLVLFKLIRITFRLWIGVFLEQIEDGTLRPKLILLIFLINLTDLMNDVNLCHNPTCLWIARLV